MVINVMSSKTDKLAVDTCRTGDRLMWVTVWVGQGTVMCSVGMMERYFCYGQANINTAQMGA